MSFSVPKMEAKYSAIFQRTSPTRQPTPPTVSTSAGDVTGRDGAPPARRRGAAQLGETLLAWGRDKERAEAPTSCSGACALPAALVGPARGSSARAQHRIFPLPPLGPRPLPLLVVLSQASPLVQL